MTISIMTLNKVRGSGEGIAGLTAYPQQCSRQQAAGDGASSYPPALLRKYWRDAVGVAGSLPRPRNNPGKYQQGKA